MFLPHHELERRIDQAVGGSEAASGELDPDLRREVLFAASRGPEALEGLLACLGAAERHAAFAMLQQESGNHATDRALGRISDEEANYRARRAALDSQPIVEPRAAAEEVTRRAEAAARAEPATPAPAPEETPAQATAANQAWMASMSARADELGAAEKEERDNALAREAYMAKKWEGNELLARALARHKRARE